MGSRRRKTEPEGTAQNPLATLVASAEADPRDFVAGREPSQLRPPAALTLPYHRLAVAPGHNPRTEFAREPLEQLAETIASIGLQQPIAVRPARDGSYRVISGERRYRAIGLLIQAGRLPEDHPVPVFLRDDLDANGLLIAALVENLQREELTPLDEAMAYQRLKAAGMGTGQLARAVGRSTRHVQLRLQLLSLVDPVREALRTREIQVTVARVIAGMPRDLQDRALRHYRASEAPFRSADALQRWVRTEVVPFDAALFDPEAYLREAPDAVYVSDGGGQDPGTRGRYFVDRQLFLRLQAEALDGLRRELRGAYEWLEELEGWELPDGLEHGPDGDGPGAVILFRKGLFDVAVFQGVLRSEERGVDDSSPSPASGPAASYETAPPVEASLIGEPEWPPVAPARGESGPRLALQEAIARDQETVLRLAIAGLLTAGPSLGLRLVPPGGPEDGLALPPTALRQLRALADRLGLSRPEDVLGLSSSEKAPTEESVYQALRTLPLASLEGVLAALVASTTAVPPPSGRGSSEPSFLVALLARDLGLEPAATPADG